MNSKNLALLAAALVMLNACGGSHRPVYSGHEESTEGVPGFVDGKKVSPHVKLGQSYTVDGETYVPKNGKGYTEEGMASWYGPGFHGGKTANGEKFDSDELTAAHRTLPLPSIVRVTLLSTGKQAVVRVNDRGPFAHSRIIDLSRGAAEKIGLVRVGVGKVRVEYMEKESQRFADLLSQGRDPKEIDVASEVLDYDYGTAPTDYARADTRVMDDSSFSAPVSDVVSADLPAPGPAGSSMPVAPDTSPFAAVDAEEAVRPVEAAALQADEQIAAAPAAGAPAPVTVVSSGYYAQLGAFSNASNAEKLRSQYSNVASLDLIEKANAKGQMLYHVRTKPYASEQEVDVAIAKLKAAGADTRLVRE